MLPQLAQTCELAPWRQLARSANWQCTHPCRRQLVFVTCRPLPSYALGYGVGGPAPRPAFRGWFPASGARVAAIGPLASIASTRRPPQAPPPTGTCLPPGSPGPRPARHPGPSPLASPARDRPRRTAGCASGSRGTVTVDGGQVERGSLQRVQVRRRGAFCLARTVTQRSPKNALTHSTTAYDSQIPLARTA